MRKLISTVRNAWLGLVLLFLVHMLDAQFEEAPMKRSWTWVLNVALLIILVAILGCTRMVYKDAPTPYVVVGDTNFWPCNPLGTCTIATAVCSEDNRPVILVRRGYAEGETKAYTKAHEDRHIEQMKGDCKKTTQAYKDSITVRERMEAEAYCAEARARLRRTRNVEMVMSWYNSMIWTLFNTNKAVCELKPP